MAKKQKKIVNRELSWLSFNERVLQEAQDSTTPLIERLRFLGIFSNNLDEFFKVRVATIKRMIDVQEGSKRVEGEKPKTILNKIQKKVIKLQNKFEYTYQNILRELEHHNIFIINEMELNPEQAIYVKRFFKEKIQPFLTPIMLHNVEEFPDLKDKSIYLATKLTSSKRDIEDEYALIEIPTYEISRFIVLPDESDRKFIILLEDIIRFCLDDVFALFNFDTFEAWTIKLTRDAELDMDNDLSKSILEKISHSLGSRKQGQPVRFVFDNAIAKDLMDYIITKLDLDDDDNLIPGARYHNFKDFMKFPNIGGPELVYKKEVPLGHKDVKYHKSILHVIARKDIMLHVPYQSFDNFINLLREASMDPKVREIKMTIYRVAQNSKVMNALINAAKNGKKVTVVVELQARFDEKSNIYWSKKLEEEGARVLFGIANLKVHSKLLLISRKEGTKVVNYASVGTGNFHEGNAGVYCDLFLLTMDRRIANEVAKVFDFFENPYKTFIYRNLLVSPLYQRRKIYQLIDNEIRNVKAGKEAYIILKINNLVDKEMIYKLYQAYNQGVIVRLIVRGICCLMPGVEELSKEIEAISIVDKYLEHARILVFCNEGDELYFISSADWMPRNLDRRIEVTAPIYSPEIKQELKDIIEIQLRDNAKARIINEAQDNPYKPGNPGEMSFRSQEITYQYYKKLLMKS
jgi:polyphosphate kinase